MITQFGHGLLNRQVIGSLAQRSLANPNSYVPWGSLPLPASILSAVPPRLQLTLAAREARLELRLVEPYLSGLHWPLVVPGDSGGQPGTAMPRERDLPHRRVAEVGWRLEVNLLTARLVSGVAEQPRSGGAPRQAGGSTGFPGGGRGAIVAARPELAVVDTPSGTDTRSWNRLLLASGHAVTRATAEVVVPTGRWRFGMELEFSESEAQVTSDDEGLTEFLATDGGKNLLAQALAPLQAASGIRLTPEIAPAGPVSPVLVQRFGLPAFSVRDVLLTNDQGHPVLSLCAELGTASDGVLRLVQPFVGRQDFAYAVSASVLDPAYKACWSVAARGLSVVGEMPVDLPVGDDPSVTRPGRAQLSVSFSDVLDEAAIKVVPALRGDAIRLLSKQRIQLLNLWDYQDKRITDLGELADPHDEILAFPLTLFEEGGAAPDALDPNVKDLMVKLLTILVFPMMQPFSIRAASVSGFCSSALQTVLVRWTHKTLIDDLRPPVSNISTRARI